jgi:hypothetical protein
MCITGKTWTTAEVKVVVEGNVNLRLRKDVENAQVG